VDEAVRMGVDRSTVILALGGGVVGDVAGFAASILMRGLRVVQVPTTVLAMVDSAIGGKTAINLSSGKNLIGSFHQPSLVFVEPSALSTLPARERGAGMVEAFKAAAIADPGLFTEFEKRDPEDVCTDSGWMVSVVRRCIRIKAALVEQDERDGAGRLLLNLGHTFGHALEAATGFGAWLHGEAVGVGLVEETELACRLSLCEDGELPDRLRRLLRRWQLPHDVREVPRDAFHRAIWLDKKAGEGNLRMPLLRRLGQAEVFDLPTGVVIDRLAEWI
jgi:3-dehydroquinate synthase